MRDVESVPASRNVDMVTGSGCGASRLPQNLRSGQSEEGESTILAATTPS